YAKAAAVLAVLVPLLLSWHGLYRQHKLLSGIEETWRILVSVLVGTAVVLVLAFFSTPPHEAFRYSRLTFGYFVLLSTAFMAMAHAAVHRWRLARYRAGIDLRRAAIVGRPQSFLVQQFLHEPAFGIEVCGFLRPRRSRRDDRRAEPASPAPRTEAESAAGEESGSVGVLVGSARRSAAAPDRLPPELGPLEAIERLIDEHGIEEVLIVEQGVRHAELLATLDVCERKGVQVHLVPPTYDLLVQPQDLVHVEGVAVIRIDERRSRRMAALVKRSFDIVVSATALLVLSPLLAAIAIAIKRDSPGPVLFGQERAGEGGRPFRMWKFRTMVADAEKRLDEVLDLEQLDEPVFKIERDPRVTRVGAWLRRSSLDELPQLWNVLRGDMSLVGPRPEEMRMVQRYDVWQRRRLKVRPGITGLQQVQCRGALSTSLAERVRLDVYYVRHQSLLLDLWILLRTVWVVVRGKGAT
ncbi:MAG: sugar transferase, partial [Planctomycetota bacterium]